MIQKDVEHQVNRLLDSVRETLLKKQKEYASDVDRLHNFKLASAFLGGTPSEALLGFVTKHFVSIRDMVVSDKDYPGAVWDEKIVDIMVYMILLRCLQEEKWEGGLC